MAPRRACTRLGEVGGVNNASRLLLIPGIVALLAEPCLWLAHTWADPAYDSDGAAVAALCGVLVLRSVASGPAPSGSAWGVLVAAAALRLVARWLDISHLGALTLALDVWGVGRLLALDRRPWPVSPAVLGALFAMSLPIERALQRAAGHPLRVASATAAEAVLRVLGVDVSRSGVVLASPDIALSVDLPCSGASGVVVLSVLALAVAAVRRVGAREAVVGAGLVALAALGANTLRLVLLFLGPTAAWLQEPAHSVVGLVALGAAACLPLAYARTLPARSPRVDVLAPPRSLPPLAAGVFSAVAIAVALAPHHPLDAMEPLPAVLPFDLAARSGVQLPISDSERAYFGTYGGGIEKRAYVDEAGEFAVLLARTEAPLRHLHAPDECLTGAGHTVEHVGVLPGPIPTTVWRTTDPEGRQWRVATSFVREDGLGAETISEVLLAWVSRPGMTWMLVERITPWSTCVGDPLACDVFDVDLFRSLDLPRPGGPS